MSATQTKRKLKPLGNKIVVKKLEAKSQTESGLYLPSGSKEQPMEAEVIAVGPGALNEKNERQSMDVKPGDVIVMGKYSGTEIKLDGEEFQILAENEVLAVVES
jgi:chaperonin GroES